MRLLPSIAFIIYGIVLISVTDARRAGTQAVVMSDVAHVERELSYWCRTKVDEGKLTQSDVRQILTQDGRLRFGGEVPERQFREMIEDIVDTAAPTSTAGYIAIVLGVLGLTAALVPAKGKDDVAGLDTKGDGGNPPAR